jgi:hypothetical protein
MNAVTEAAIPSLESLFTGSRLDKRIYTDAAVFDLEMERLFGRAWLLLGHECQVPSPAASCSDAWAGTRSSRCAARTA